MAGGPGSNFDAERFFKDFRQMSLDVDALKAAAGLGTIVAGPEILKGWHGSIGAAGGVIAANTDGVRSFATGVEIPANMIVAGSRVDVVLAFTAEPQTAPWSFALKLDTGSATIPVSDAQSVSSIPGSGSLTGVVRFSGHVRDAGGTLQLVPDGLCAWNWSTLKGSAVNSDFTPVTIDATSALTLTPTITITGATVGDTVQLRTLDVQVTGPSDNGGT